MHMKTRRIGPMGTTTRLLAAAGLLYLAFFDGVRWASSGTTPPSGSVSCRRP